MSRASLVDLVKQHVEQAQWDRAERRVRLAAERTASGSSANEVVQAVLTLAAEYVSWNKREKAEALLEWAASWLVHRDRGAYGDIVRALGNLQTDLNKLDQAVRTLNAAFEAHRSARGENSREVVLDLMGLANVARAADNTQLALSLLGGAIERTEEASGAGSTDLIAPLKEQADVLLSSDLEHEERCVPAEGTLRRLLRLQEAVDGESLDTGWTLLDLAELLHDHEQCDEALDVGRRAWELGRTHLLADASLFEQSTSWLASWYEGHQRYEALIDLLRQALDIWAKLVGQDHPKIAQTMGMLANALLLNDQLGEAERLCARAEDIYLRHYGELPGSSELMSISPPDLASIRLSVASVLSVHGAVELHRGQAVAAQFLHRKALLLLDLPADDLPDETRVTLATARADVLRQLAQSTPSELAAEHLFRRAISEAQEAGAGVVADTLDDYADWLQARGREDEAEETRRQAEAAWDKADEGD